MIENLGFMAVFTGLKVSTDPAPAARSQPVENY